MPRADRTGIPRRKERLRRELRQLLNAMPVPSRRRKSLTIVRRLIRTEFFKKARSIVTYVALPTEVDTRRVIAKALATGKKVCVPRVSLRARTMKTFEIRDMERDLRPGAYGILEPRKGSREVRGTQFDLILCPGLGFDRRGRRLGRGAGYFDRFLKAQKRAFKVGLGFREQVVARVPATGDDVAMDFVIAD
ncbi:MAG: 5-formyltetrahydrofolate cyclo-ligase [Candidatus Omnitrophota bacterium]